MLPTFFRKQTPTNLSQLESLIAGLNMGSDSRSLDDNTVQRTVVYDRNPSVVIVASLKHKTPIERYELLPEFSLTPEQLIVIERDVKPKIRYDGDNLLVSNCQYDESRNCIYLEAVRAKYSVLAALSSKRIMTDKFFFKTGVMVPLMTTDKNIVFIQRNDAHRLFSAPSGFLQPLQETGELVFTYGAYTADLVRGTALKELREEVFGEPNQLQNLKLSENLGLSIRYFNNGSVPTIEFIQPAQVNYTASDLITLLNANQSVDAEEHLKNYFVFDYATPESFRGSFEKIGSPDKPGYFLYLPMLETIFPNLNERIRGELSQESISASFCK